MTAALVTRDSPDRLYLITLGGLRLTRGGAPVGGAAARRKPLALLAFLAGANSHGVSRDKVTAFFWPEADTEAARTALRQTLYTIRHSLPEKDLVLGTNDLRLNPAVIGSDREDFEEALAAGRWERAIELYQGPFLDGFHLPEAPGFARWQDDERSRCEARLRTALEGLARSADARLDLDDAVRWWTRLAEADPLSSRVTMALMTALVRSGDRARALHVAESHLHRLASDLGVAGDSAITMLAGQIRATSVEPVPGTSVAPTPGIREATASSDGVNAAADAPDPDSRRSAAAPLPRHKGLSRFRVGAGIVLATAALAIVWPRENARSLDGSPPLLALFPFEVSGDNVAYLGAGIPKLLAAGLDGTGKVRVADERAVKGMLAGGVTSVLADSVARHLGADHYVTGSIVHSGGSLRVVTALRASTDSTPAIVRTADGDTSQVFAMVDRLVVELTGALLRGPAERLAAAASVTTSSLAAYKAFLEGEEHMRAFRYAQALAAYRVAVEIDTTFALAFHRLSEAADWNGLPSLVDSAAEKAVRYSNRLSDRERRLLSGMRDWRIGETDRAEATLEHLVRYYPLDVEGWYQLGEVRFHSSPLQGRPLRHALAPLERALELEPTNRGALRHLQRLYAYQGRITDSDALGRRIREVEGDTGRFAGNTLTVFSSGSRAQRDSLVARMQAWPTGQLLDGIRHTVYTANLSDAERLTRMYVARALSPAERRDGVVTLAEILAAMGRVRAADAVLASSTGVPPDSLIAARATLALLPYAREALGAAHFATLGRLLSTRGNLRDTTRAGLGVAYAAYLRGVLAARAGDVPGATRIADDLLHPALSQRTRGLSRAYARGVRAELLSLRGDPAGALRQLVDSQPPVPLELQQTLEGSMLLARWRRAELMRELGDTDGALAWYEAMCVTSTHELPLLAMTHLRRAQVLRRRGDTAARIHYRRFTTLWEAPDAALGGLVHEARRHAP